MTALAVVDVASISDRLESFIHSPGVPPLAFALAAASGAAILPAIAGAADPPPAAGGAPTLNLSDGQTLERTVSVAGRQPGGLDAHHGVHRRRPRDVPGPCVRGQVVEPQPAAGRSPRPAEVDQLAARGSMV